MTSTKDKKLWKICMDIYREAFKKAEPSADFDKLLTSGEAKKPQFFMRYFLEQEVQMGIFEKHTKKNKLSKHDAHRVCKEVTLGSLPNTSRKTWLEVRGEENGIKRTARL